MKKLNSILSIISLCITSFLLVLLVFAWYATNKTANVENATGSVADLDDIVSKIEYYNFRHYDADTHEYQVNQYVLDDKENLERYMYTFGYTNDNVLSSRSEPQGVSGFSMVPYDYLKSSYTKYLIKITLKQGKSLSNIQLISTASYFIGFTGGANDNGIVDNAHLSNLSMSSVVKFGCYAQTATLPTINSVSTNSTTYENALVTITENPNFEHFEYDHDGKDYYGAITTSKVSVDSGRTALSNENLEIYLVIDYNVDALNAFYGYNLGSTWTNVPNFDNLDFKIFILG